MSSLVAPIRAWLATFIRDESGGSAAEFALVVPFFILLIFGTIETSIMLSAVIQLHYSAERAARCLSVNVSGACSTGAIDAYAKGFYNGPPLTGMTFTTSAPACGHLVTGTGTYTVLDGFHATDVSIRAKACYPVI
jgi:Flp pilus assembly protein TadG